MAIQPIASEDFLLDSYLISESKPRYVKNHFGYSVDDDALTACSDNIYVKPGEGPCETYKYERPELPEENLKKIIVRRFQLFQRLKTEFDAQKIARIQTALKNIEGTLSRNKTLVSKVIQQVYGKAL